MINIPVIRWGEPYESLDTEEVIHHRTGEVLAKVGQANPGLLARDMRQAARAREVLREIPIKDLVEMMKKAGDLYLNATLPLGDGVQTPDDFARQQSASTGLPEHMCKFNMEKNHFVLNHMDQILDSLTRGLDISILERGFGVEDRGVPISYQAQSPVLGMVLPSNSPRRSHAVDAGHPHANRPHPQARPARAVDALPHVRRLHRGRCAQGSHRHLSRRRRDGRRDGFALRPRYDFW